MKRLTWVLLGGVAVLFGDPRPASAATGVCQLASGVACTTTSPPTITSPSGFGQYCSVTWASGGWSFAWNANLTGDPCTYIFNNSGPGGTVQHSGMYSVSGENNVVARCTDGHVILYYGDGSGPLTNAFNAAGSHPGCSFNVSPRSFPVFDAPISLSPLPTGYEHGSGFDFARSPYYYVDLLDDFRETGGRTQSYILDYQGTQRDGANATTIASGSNGLSLPQSTIYVASTSAFSSLSAIEVGTNEGAAILSCTGSTATTFTGCSVTGGAGSGTLATGNLAAQSWGFIDDHQGHDMLMAQGTPIYAVADGVVDMARFRDVTYACGSGNGTQGEIYIRHHFSGGNSQYDEWYESYYAHLETISVSTGHTVSQGDLLGYSGHTGCTGGTNHLHMSVFRLTNTASALSYPLVINTDFSAGKDQNSDLGWKIVIDPWGFVPPTSYAFDPWAWRGITSTTDWGAQSVNLWASSEAPPLTPYSGWPVEW